MSSIGGTHVKCSYHPTIEGYRETLDGVRYVYFLDSGVGIMDVQRLLPGSSWRAGQSRALARGCEGNPGRFWGLQHQRKAFPATGHWGVWFLKAAALKLCYGCLLLTCRRELYILFSVPGFPAQLVKLAFHLLPPPVLPWISEDTSPNGLAGVRSHACLPAPTGGEVGAAGGAAVVWWGSWSPGRRMEQPQPFLVMPLPQWSSFSFWNGPHSVGEAPGFQKP